MRSISGVVAVSVLLLTSSALADIDSGPKAGNAISPLNVFAATGDDAGKELDISTVRGKKPTIYIFVQHNRFDRPLARLLKVLEKGTINAGNDSGLTTIFLTGDEAKTKEHLPRIQMSLQFTHNPLAIFPSSTTSPDGWAVNTDAQLTAIVVNDAHVIESFGYRSANETVAPEILTSLKQAIKK